MSFFNAKDESSFSLAIALKSSSVDLQLMRVYPDGGREILLAKRRIILLEDSTDPNRYTKQFLAELSATLKASAREIQALTKGNVSRTVIMLYAPWFTSTITQIVHPEPATISEHFIMGKLSSIQPAPGLVNLEKKVIKILMNGYSVSEFTRSKAGNVSMDVYSSYVSSGIYATLNETVKKALPFCRKTAYVTSPMLVFDQIKSLMVNEDNVSYVYVGGEVTEIGVIEDDSLAYYVTFPIGKHDFLRQIRVQAQGYDYDLLYQKEVQIKGKAQTAKFDALKTQWSDMMAAALMSYKRHVPSKLLVISDSKTRDFFTNLVTSRIKGDKDGFLAHHRIISFDVSRVKDIISYKTPAHNDELDLQLEALT